MLETIIIFLNISGAAGGIGKAICTKFAKEGAKLVLVDLNKDRLHEAFEQLTKEYGDKHFQACGDVSDSNFAHTLFENVVVSIYIQLGIRLLHFVKC